MKGIANLVVLSLGLSLGWDLGKESLPKEVEYAAVSESLLGQRQTKAFSKAIDASLPKHLRLQALAEQEDVADASSLKASLGAILESKDEDALANLMRQWVALDPQGCFAYCRDVVGGGENYRCLKAWASQWALADSKTVIAEIESLLSLSTGEVRYIAMCAIGTTLGRTYPDEVLALMKRSGHLDSEVLIAVSEAAPQKAMAIARTKNDDFTARSILQSWLARDQEAALRYFSDQEEGAQRDLLEPMGRALAKVDPKLALDYMAEHRHLAKDSGTEYRVFQAVGKVLLDKGEGLAMAFLEDLASGKSPHQGLLTELLPKFAEKEPAQGFSLALRQADKETLARVVGKFARKDWDTAFASVMDLEEDSDRNRALEGLLSIYSSLPLDLPPDRLDSLLRTAEENDLEINVGVAMKLMPMEQSEALIAKYPETLDASLEYFLWARSSSDLKQLAERLPDSPGKYRGLERAVKAWSEKDPVGAAEWVRNLEFEGDPGGLYEPILTSWSAYDPVAAGEWLNSLDNAEQRTAAVSAYVSANAVVRSAEAWQAATEHGDLELQRLAMKGWAGTDPDAAAKALEGMDNADPTLWEAYEAAAQEHRTWDRFLNP